MPTNPPPGTPCRPCALWAGVPDGSPARALDNPGLPRQGAAAAKQAADQKQEEIPADGSDEERLPPRSDDDIPLEAPLKVPFKAPLIGYPQQNNPAFFPGHRHSAKPRPRRHTRVTLPDSGTDGAHLDNSLVQHLFAPSTQTKAA